MPKHVLIYGHSFVDRLDKFSNYPGNKWQNLCLDGTEIQVSFYGVPGGTLNPGPKSIQRHSDIVLSTCPDAIFLQIGGNDLSDPLVNPHTLAVNIMSFAHYLITVFNVNHVIIGQLLFRFSRRCPNDYNERVISLNDRLRVLCSQYHNISFWHHRGLWRDIKTMLDTDNTHLKPRYMPTYARSVKVAVGSHFRRRLF